MTTFIEQIWKATPPPPPPPKTTTTTTSSSVRVHFGATPIYEYLYIYNKRIRKRIRRTQC